MNRSTFALFVALLIHLVLSLLLWFITEHMPIRKEQKSPAERTKISLKEYIPKKKEAEPIKKSTSPEIMAKPMPKGSQLKELTKQQPVKFEPKQKPKEVKLNTPQEIATSELLPKPAIELLPPKEHYIPLTTSKTDENRTKSEKPKKEEQKNPLYAMLSQDKSAFETKEKVQSMQAGSNINQDIKKLYGDEFGKLTKGQQQYILDNQEIMRRITQEVLNRVARVNITNDMNVNRDNVIEFYLHPNGDMTDFRYLKKSGYYVLDETTRETIEYSYSRYPRPNEKILIRYNVYYNLARY